MATAFTTLTGKTEFYDFLHDCRWDDLPEAVQQRARICLLDLLGVAVVGRQTKSAQIALDHAATMMAAGDGMPSATLLFDGRSASPAGAALAGGMMIDSIDAHDGYKQVKGHAGCGVLPGLLAQLEAADKAKGKGTSDKTDGKALLTHLAVGYELAIRCGLALHQSVSDYHTSGAWVALAVAALGARIYGMDKATTREAVGIAEYHGPRSQMMRVIDHSSNLKDGSGWGAMVGVSAADMARRGFTGAPAITIEAEAETHLFTDLGSAWHIMDMYFKPWPVCRWAQPALQAVLDLNAQSPIDPEQIESVQIHTFHEATRLAAPHPKDTDQAQYSICWPVAAALVAESEGRVFGPIDVMDDMLARADIHALADKIQLIDTAEISARFPDERFARVVVQFKNGEKRESELTKATGDPEKPLGDPALITKFDQYVENRLSKHSASMLKAEILTMGLEHRSSEAFWEIISASFDADSAR